jgi:hypothetical protein
MEFKTFCNQCIYQDRIIDLPFCHNTPIKKISNKNPDLKWCLSQNNKGNCSYFEQKPLKMNCNYCNNKSDFTCSQCPKEYNYYHFSFKKWLNWWLFEKWKY